MSLPVPPIRVSVPPPPSSVLLPVLPVMVLAPVLPVPLMLPTPVSVRFSTLAAENEADDWPDEVGSFAGRFGDRVAAVNDVDVVALAADQGVGAAAAVQRVVAGIAGDGVGAGIAGAIDVAAAGQRQVLEIGAEGEGDARLHEVGAFAGRFGDRVAAVDDIDVVALAADQVVGAAAAIQRVVAGIAGDRVGTGVARAVDVAAAGQRQILDVRAENEADARLHEVGALAGVLGDRVAAVDDVDVVARAADQSVGAGAAVQRVVAAYCR